MPKLPPNPYNLGNLPLPRFRVEAHPAPPGMPKGGADWLPLREVVAYKLWRNTQPGISKNTERSQRITLCYALAELPEKPVPADIEAWHRALVEKAGLTPITANKYMGWLSAAYECARTFGGALANPCKLVAEFSEPAPQHEALGGPVSAAEIYERARVICTAREKVALALLYWTGICRGELLGLEPHHVDEVAEMLVIEQLREGRSRAGKAGRLKRPSRRRRLPLALLPERERGELLALARLGGGTYHARNQHGPLVESPYLFPWSDETIYRGEGLMQKLRAIAPEFFSRHKAFHQFRHVAMEAADEQTNGNIGKVGDLAGHAGPQSTGRYLRGRRGNRFSKLDAAALAEHRQKYKPAAVLKLVGPRSRKRHVAPQGKHGALSADSEGGNTLLSEVAEGRELVTETRATSFPESSGK